MEEGIHEGLIGDLDASIRAGIVRLEAEKTALPHVEFIGEYPLSTLADISGLTNDVLNIVIRNRNVISTPHGYRIDSVIAALRNYVDEEQEIEEPEAMVA